jgi:hypothetical protein
LNPVKTLNNVLLNIVADAVFKLFMLNIADVYKLYELLSVIVNEAFKLFMLNIADVDKLFTIEFNENKLTPEAVTLLSTFKVEGKVIISQHCGDIDIPDTF